MAIIDWNNEDEDGGLVKHYVRTRAWLPICQSRLQAIRKKIDDPRHYRRLRYFTFCASGATDVLMLDVAGVVTRSKKGGFDTVTFFDKDPESVFKALQVIRGAVAIPGKFTSVVLTDDVDEESAFPYYGETLQEQDELYEAAIEEEIDANAPLAPTEHLRAVQRTHSRQVRIEMRRKFIERFPFDVINLDLTDFLFKPNDPIPGKVINSLREIWDWQKLPIRATNETIDEFSLLFTTQIGPPNLNDEYLDILTHYLEENLARDETLRNLLTKRAGTQEVAVLKNENFSDFFKLAVPKALASTLMEKDWFVDCNTGIRIYEFTRDSKEGQYSMLHLVMDIKRQNPPMERRAPHTTPQEVDLSYRRTVRRIFEEDVEFISAETVKPHEEELQQSLQLIRARRRKYRGD